MIGPTSSDCNIYSDINDAKLPAISGQEFQNIKLMEVDNYFSVNNELVAKILQREVQIIDDHFEVDHKFIDFSFLIIGVKLRKLKSKTPFVLDN